MKIVVKLIMLIITLATIKTAFADDSAANIKIRISGATSDNRYFLCMPDTGCLSIRSGVAGKVFPIFHSVDMSSIYVTDVSNNFQVSGQPTPTSCNVTVDPSHSVTITGSIAVGANHKVRINQLHCTVS